MDEKLSLPMFAKRSSTEDAGRVEERRGLVGTAIDDNDDADCPPVEDTEKERRGDISGCWAWSTPSPSTRSASAFRRAYSALLIQKGVRKKGERHEE